MTRSDSIRKELQSQVLDLYRPWLNAGHRHDYRDLGVPVTNAA
jgi:hypothetical protein